MKQEQILVVKGKWVYGFSFADGFHEYFFFLTPMITFEFSNTCRGILWGWFFWAGSFCWERTIYKTPLHKNRILSGAHCTCKRLYLNWGEHYLTCDLIKEPKHE